MRPPLKERILFSEVGQFVCWNFCPRRLVVEVVTPIRTLVVAPAVAVRILQKPQVIDRRVVHGQIHQDFDVVLVADLGEKLKVCHRAVSAVDSFVVVNAIAEVIEPGGRIGAEELDILWVGVSAAGAGVDGRKPQVVYTHTF